jgi:spermidine/putrescine transport system permease protein
LGPLVYLVVVSFLERGGGIDISGVFTLSNYAKIFKGTYLNAFWASVKLAFFATLITVLIGYPLGLFMSQLSGKAKTFAFVLLIIPFWTSALMRLNGWLIFFGANGTLDDILQAVGLTSKPLKLLYTGTAELVGMVYILLPFMVYSIYASAEKLDKTLLDASKDLGASRVKTFFTVILPLTSPGLFSGIVLTFVPSMGLYYVTDLLGGNKSVYVGNILSDHMSRGNDRPFAAAISMALLLFTALTLFLYRKITRQKELEGLI